MGLAPPSVAAAQMVTLCGFGMVAGCRHGMMYAGIVGSDDPLFDDPREDLMDKTSTVNRRNFLSALGVTVGGTGLAGITAKPTKAQYVQLIEESWG